MSEVYTPFEQRIVDGYLKATYPDEPAAPDLQEAATMMTLPEDAKNIPLSTFGKMAMDVPAGLAKGAVQGTIGLPGDLISLARGVAAAASPNAGEGRLDAFLRGTKGATILPTTEDVKKFLDETLGVPLVPAGETDQIRRESAGVTETVGELFGGGKTALGLGKATAQAGAAIGREAKKASAIVRANEPLVVEEPLAATARSDAISNRKRTATAKPASAAADEPGVIESVQFVKLPDGRFATSTALQETRKVAVGFDQASTPDRAAHITAGLRKSPQEQLVAVVLDADDRPIQIVRHTIGLAAQTSAEPFSLLGAISNTPGAKSFWLSHNHPSGNPELSAADRNLANALNRISTGTGIEMRGILAIGKSKFAAYSPDGKIDIAGSDIPAAARKTSINMVERTFRKSNVLDSIKVSSPQEARVVAQQVAGNESGLVLFNSARQPVAFIPMQNVDLENLRQTGLAKQILGALEKANATATMYVTKLNPDMKGIANLQAMLDQVGSPMFDALVGANRESLASQGLPKRLADFKSVFPAAGTAAGAAATMQTNEEGI
jgi:hypothetical protein